MEYTLLVYAELPEEVKYYLIPNEVAEKYRNFLGEAHNRMVNSDEMNDGMDFLSLAISDQPKEDDWVQQHRFKEHHGVFVTYRYIYTATPITGYNITKVYMSGFHL